MLLLNLVRGMDRDNFCPEVVCLKEAGELSQEFSRCVPVHSGFLRSKYDVRVLVRLKRLFQRRPADAVITVGAGDKMFWGRLAARWAGVPVVCSALHSTGWPDGIGRLNRLLTPITDGFIAVARNHARHLVLQEGFPEARVFMIPNGVDTQRFAPDPSMRNWLRTTLGLPLDTPLVGIVAALRPEKNHAQFVQAGRRVIQEFPNCHFVIVGDGPERQSLMAEIRSAKYESHFHLLGSRPDTHRILAGLDVFCLTSKNEANPVSILEALSCEVPVVSPDVGSIRETVLEGQTGILTRPLDAEASAQAICRLLADPTEARRLGQHGRQLVQAAWSLSAMIEGYQSLVERLYNQKALSAGNPPWSRAPHSGATSPRSDAGYSKPPGFPDQPRESLGTPSISKNATPLAGGLWQADHSSSI